MPWAASMTKQSLWFIIQVFREPVVCLIIWRHNIILSCFYAFCFLIGRGILLLFFPASCPLSPFLFDHTVIFIKMPPSTHSAWRHFFWMYTYFLLYRGDRYIFNFYGKIIHKTLHWILLQLYHALGFMAFTFLLVIVIFHCHVNKVLIWATPLIKALLCTFGNFILLQALLFCNERISRPLETVSLSSFHRECRKTVSGYKISGFLCSPWKKHTLYGNQQAKLHKITFIKPFLISR